MGRRQPTAALGVGACLGVGKAGKGGRGPNERGIARTVMCGGVWAKERLNHAGYSLPDSACHLCGQKDSLHHRLWRCGAPRVRELRSQVLRTTHGDTIARACATAEECPLHTEAWISFDPPQHGALAEASEGNPRTLNLLAQAAWITAARLGESSISAAHVQSALRQVPAASAKITSR